MAARRKLSKPLTAPVAPDAGVAGSAYYDPVERIIYPATAESILAGAWGGDMRDTRNLFTSACDTWDRLADNMRTVENALIAAPFEFQPFASPDGSVSDSAKEKAELVDYARKQLRLACLILRNEARRKYKEDETLLRWADELENDGNMKP